MSNAGCERQPNDGELVMQARRGSMDAFDILVARYRKSIYRLARAMTQDHDAADDLSQETFVRAYKSIRGLKDPERFGPWLRKILVNLTIRYSTSRRVHAPLEETEIKAPDSPSTEAEKTVVRETVRSAIMGLDLDQRAVVLLYYMEGLTQAEVAETLDCPLGTVWSRLNSARRKLKGRLANLIV